MLAPAEPLPAGAVAADEDGVLDEDELDGALEPLAALPLDGDAGAAELELDEPPEAGALGAALDEELELLSVELLSVDDEPIEPEAEPDAEPDGEVEDEPDGEVVEPADEEEPGALAPVFPAPSRSQPASKLAPSAMDTATARVESFMWPPWLGYDD